MVRVLVRECLADQGEGILTLHQVETQKGPLPVVREDRLYWFDLSPSGDTRDAVLTEVFR